MSLIMWSALCLLLTALLATGQELRWHNTYDNPLNFQCPPKESIVSIKSEHSNYYEDRLWEFGCEHTFSYDTDCFLSPYVNDFDREFTYECPPHHVISGMSSYHSNQYEDRRWQIYCCRSKNSAGVSDVCQWTTYVNYFDESFHWTAPHNSVLVGVESFHQNSQEDRRWKYKYCTQQ